MIGEDAVLKQIDNKDKATATDNLRHGVAWILIAAALLFIGFSIFYNINAVLMLFGKGELKLHSYHEMMQTIQTQPLNYQLKDYGENFLSYQTIDKAANITVQAQKDEVKMVHLSIDADTFIKFSLIEKYVCVDEILSSLFKSRYVLAAEIAVLQSIGNLTFNFQNSDKMFIQNLDFKLCSVYLHMQDDMLLISMIVK